MASNPLHQAAVDFLLAHQAEHLSPDRRLLIHRCIEHLYENQLATRLRAEVVTLQALGDIASRSTGVTVDLDHTTSYAVFVTDPTTGKRVCFTAQDLLRLSRDYDFHAGLRDRRVAATH
ncbi:MAG: hypothetical protein ACTHJ9_05360 [Rhodanobacter sp.]